MVADCIPRSLMEGDWTDNTNNVDPSIFPTLSFFILHHLDIKVTHLSVSKELWLSFHMMNRGLRHPGEKLTFSSAEHSICWFPKFLSNLNGLASWTGYVHFSDVRFCIWIETIHLWHVEVGMQTTGTLKNEWTCLLRIFFTIHGLNMA